MARTEAHIAFLDRFRGVAIALVFAYHALTISFDANELKWNGNYRDFYSFASFLALFPFTLGWIGVPIFFVVSGFCIHLSYERSTHKGWKVFFLRRFFRIYPPYLAAVAFFACLIPWTRYDFKSLYCFYQVGTHALLIHNFDPHTAWAISSAFWSIAVEVQLYLLYPLLLICVRRWGWRGALFLVGFLEIGLQTIVGWAPIVELSIPTWIKLSPFAFWFSWSIGAALADRYIRGTVVSPGKFWIWLCPILTVVTNCIKPLSTLTFFFAALSTATLLAHQLAKRTNGLEPPLVRLDYLGQVGIWSYSLYLIHQPLLKMVPRAMQFLSPSQVSNHLLTYLCCLASSVLFLLASWCFYRLVELPSIAIGKLIISTRISRPLSREALLHSSLTENKVRV
jgi:peptidoglycan/LPS O-acetylase OafA/YrhL